MGCCDRHDGAGLVSDRERPHDGAAASRSVWDDVCRFSRSRRPHASRQVPESAETTMAALDEELNRGWNVTFEPNRGARSLRSFDRLNSWSENSDYGIKYFSGTATYSKTIEIRGGRFQARCASLARPRRCEGDRCGQRQRQGSWHRVEDAVQNRRNRSARAGRAIDVNIEVTNLWVNRMIGDQQPWSMKKYTFADFMPYKADSPLLPSGLLGPVRLISQTNPTNP